MGQPVGSYVETKTLPVYEPAEVIVCGAGSAGIVAALASARNGAKTLLVDPFGSPGGTMVSGLPLLGFYDGARPMVGGIPRELLKRLASAGGMTGDPDRQDAVTIDPELLKFVALQMLTEAGVELLLHTYVCDALVDEESRLWGIVVEGKGGRRVLRAKRFVDATGDADVAVYAGVPFAIGRESDGAVQSLTMMFTVGNVDLERFNAWGGYKRARDLWVTLQADGKFRNPRRTDLSGFWHVNNRAGELSLNVTRITGVNAGDPQQLTYAEIEGRRQVWEFLYDFLKPHVPGFENAYIVYTASKVGVRETRRIVGEYVLTEEDVVTFRKFDDAIALGCWPIDIHSPSGDGTRYLRNHFYGGKHYTIPWRCLIPKKVDNLLVAGRCISATHEALSAVRVMAQTMCMGQAAGTACAMSIEANVTPRELDVPALLDRLRSMGAVLNADDAERLKSQNAQTA